MIALYLLIICLDYVLRMSIDVMKEFLYFSIGKRLKYPTRTITDAKYADDIAFLANIPTQSESRLQSLERATSGTGFPVNEDKTEFMCFNQRGDICILNERSLKLVDKFIYLGNNVLFIENDIKMQLAKVWATIDRLLVIWKSDLSDKIKRSFFPPTVVLYGCTTYVV